MNRGKSPTAKERMAEFLAAEELRNTAVVESQVLERHIDSLREGFSRCIKMWENTGLFETGVRDKNLEKPDFDRDYLPLLSLPILRQSASVDHVVHGGGCSIPVWTPYDLPLGKGDPSESAPATLLACARQISGFDFRNVSDDFVYLEKYRGGRSSGDNIAKTGVSQQELFRTASGVEARTGGRLRLENPYLLSPSSLAQTKFSPSGLRDFDLDASVLPRNVTGQTINEAVTFLMMWMGTKGFSPDNVEIYKGHYKETVPCNVIATRTATLNGSPSGIRCVLPDEFQPGDLTKQADFVCDAFWPGKESPVTAARFGIRINDSL